MNDYNQQIKCSQLVALELLYLELCFFSFLFSLGNHGRGMTSLRGFWGRSLKRKKNVRILRNMERLPTSERATETGTLPLRA